jgi:hypothetical protein
MKVHQQLAAVIDIVTAEIRNRSGAMPGLLVVRPTHLANDHSPHTEGLDVSGRN